jgi:hypothetical protein
MMPDARVPEVRVDVASSQRRERREEERNPNSNRAMQTDQNSDSDACLFVADRNDSELLYSKRKRGQLPIAFCVHFVCKSLYYNTIE